MDVCEAIRSRQSVRAYLPDLPTRDEIETLIDLAIHAPSAANRQFWSFNVICEAARLDEISQGAKAFMTRRRPLDLPEHLYEKLADPAFHVFYKAPALIVVSGRRGAPWLAEDCALAAQNLMLGAHALGFGSCWIGLCQPFLNEPQGRLLAGLDEDEIAIAPIIVGRPAAASHPVARKPAQINWVD
jgi:nitroreductase